MSGKNLVSRIARLENVRAPKDHRQFVYYVSEPPTFEELEDIAHAAGPVVVAPRPCNTVEEWSTEHSPREALQ